MITIPNFIQEAIKGGVKPDLMITDIVMPQMDGTQLIKHVRETRGDLKVICISGYAEEAFRKRLVTVLVVLSVLFIGFFLYGVLKLEQNASDLLLCGVPWGFIQINNAPVNAPNGHHSVVENGVERLGGRVKGSKVGHLG